MTSVLLGFATIGTIIGLGVLLAHLGVLGLDTQAVLSRLAFFVASPALMVTVVGDADVAELFSRTLLASAGAILLAGLLYIVVAHYLWRRSGPHVTIGTMSAVYVNAGNLGLPIAAYVLGDAALIAPMLLMQMLVIQPLALGVMDTLLAPTGFSFRRAALTPFANPISIASMIGVVLAATGWVLPAPVRDPLELVAGMAVPSMLLAYGVSLRLGPKPGQGTSAFEIGFITVVKLVIQPTVAYLLGRFALGLEGTPLLAVTVVAALPTAQNIFVIATRYGQGVVVARDAIFTTTVLSVPALVAIVALVA